MGYNKYLVENTKYTSSCFYDEAFSLPFQLFTEFWKSRNHGYKQFLHTRNKFIFMLLYEKIFFQNEF